jgi:hypothetical protein
VFAEGAGLQRVERRTLRWRLDEGYELELALDGPRSPRLSLFAGAAARPMVEWALGVGAVVLLNNPAADQPGAPRWRDHGVPMPDVAAELQARHHLFEHVQAIAVMRGLL